MTPSYQLPSTYARAPLAAGVLSYLLLAGIGLACAGLALRVITAACGAG